MRCGKRSTRSFISCLEHAGEAEAAEALRTVRGRQDSEPGQ